MWMLFVIVLKANVYFVAPKGPFMSMEECFIARDRSLATFPKPKINYEAVCIQTDKVGV
jgi:hypothetical protein